jgi:hypothetical protein
VGKRSGGGPTDRHRPRPRRLDRDDAGRVVLTPILSRGPPLSTGFLHPAKIARPSTPSPREDWLRVFEVPVPSDQGPRDRVPSREQRTWKRRDLRTLRNLRGGCLTPGRRPRRSRATSGNLRTLRDLRWRISRPGHADEVGQEDLIAPASSDPVSTCVHRDHRPIDRSIAAAPLSSTRRSRNLITIGIFEIFERRNCRRGVLRHEARSSSASRHDDRRTSAGQDLRDLRTLRTFEGHGPFPIDVSEDAAYDSQKAGEPDPPSLIPHAALPRITGCAGTPRGRAHVTRKRPRAAARPLYTSGQVLFPADDLPGSASGSVGRRGAAE